jgi:hypothetical protein
MRNFSETCSNSDIAERHISSEKYEEGMAMYDMCEDIPSQRLSITVKRKSKMHFMTFCRHNNFKLVGESSLF